MPANKKARSRLKHGDLYKELSPRIPLLVRRGFTEVEVAKTLGITDMTLRNWKKKYPEFFESMQDWKWVADGKVVRSCYERACGYTHPEVKVKWIDDVVVAGKIVRHGRWETIELTKHYPPDTMAIMYWLNNRYRKRPDREWQQKQTVEVGGKDGSPIDVRYSEVDNAEALRELGNKLIDEIRKSKTK